jgi:hypothetical protein
MKPGSGWISTGTRDLSDDTGYVAFILEIRANRMKYIIE